MWDNAPWRIIARRQLAAAAYRTQGITPADVTELANFNADRGKVLHSPEYVEHMAWVQDRFDSAITAIRSLDRRPATERNVAMANHPAGKLGRRPGVRAVWLVGTPQTIVLESVIGGGVPRTVIVGNQVRALECIVCGTLLAPGSPLAAAHVESHRGPRWRRSIRDTRIALRRRWRKR